MYTPRSFQFQDQEEMIGFMKQYSFATIVTIKDRLPIATHLPFVVNDNTGKLVLSAHFAAANEQAKYIETTPALVIFSEPHAYISPVHYDKHESVPTWDYIAVHAYGQAQVLSDTAAKVKVLEQMITFYDPAYLAQWHSLPDKYRQGMIQGIVAFELEVTNLQGQKKLSQNKTAAERERIAAHLEKSEQPLDQDLARHIRNL
ncbi:FMN-binding negative transcriptional regulator [Chitinophaga polysaccharea]|uniref:FMN-binding negative transcriptional regulator n=1 Tax=Chitinophaga TaxID=79328 RepID=UPI001455C745|nr:MULTISPECIES: FMN-binding negative transcriptional regulator [Chitinophaga]NLR58277.1 FMN-binding negative transcriptional regulator [Chitinophaga polysaccharea]NLU90803.1 FMN-binding negative transcriptional regulator [Chitinophaga sp. Ak27]